MKPSKTPKLIKRFELNDDLKYKELKKLFSKLDLDEDGHLSFDLVQNIFCKNLTQAQLSYIKQVFLSIKFSSIRYLTEFIIKIYNILSDSTYFGLNEFISFILILEAIKKQKFKGKQTPKVFEDDDLIQNFWDIFIHTDFDDYKKDIIEYMVRSSTKYYD